MRTSTWRRALWLGVVSCLVGVSMAYEVALVSDDPVRQVCSGMWASTAKRDAFIEVIFSPSSMGQAALVIYEGADAKYLGVDVNKSGSTNDWSEERDYVCTLDAVQRGACKDSQLGKFITTKPEDASGDNKSSIFTTSVRFDPVPGAPVQDGEAARSSGPYRYNIEKTGYYCVGIVPVTTDDQDPDHPTKGFLAIIDFSNVFEGHLPASEYPKIAFYFYLFLYFVVIGIAWAFLLYRNRGDILSIQHYVSGTIVLLVVEYLVVWQYFRYQNGNSHASVSALLLFLVAVLNSGRNAMSFFLLLITSMGYSIVRPSLGGVMVKIRLLAIVHFVFGMLYSIGAVTIPIETGGFFTFIFILPLAFTLTAFLMWIIWSLNSTIADLGMRKQAYKKSMFVSLYRILVCVVAVILAFFIVTFVSFHNRLSSGFAPGLWKVRWILTDGWLGILYATAFSAIAWLWRPASHNRRLALSDELPTDETDAEAYDIDSIARRASRDDKHGERDHVVFDVGEDDEDDDDSAGSMTAGRRSDEGLRMNRNGEQHHMLSSTDDDDDVRRPLKSSKAD